MEMLLGVAVFCLSFRCLASCWGGSYCLTVFTAAAAAAVAADADDAAVIPGGGEDLFGCNLFGSALQQQQEQQQEQQPKQPKPHQQDIVFVSDVMSYLATICQPQQQNEQGGGATAVAAAGPLSYAALRRLPLEQQVAPKPQIRNPRP